MELKSLNHYLSQTLDSSVHVQRLESPSNIPYMLLDDYDFARVELYGSEFVALVEKPQVEHGPATIRKHVDIAQQRFGRPCVFVSVAMNSTNRQRLIQQRVPFIVPGNQMFLPPLGIDLREHFFKRCPVHSEVEPLSPAAQALVIHCLNTRVPRYSLLDLTLSLSYSKMTASRVADELEAAGLLKTERLGKARVLDFPEPRQLWDQAQPRLASPVRKILTLERNAVDLDGFILSGESALARYSTLNPPGRPVIAMSGGEWKGLQDKGVRPLDFGDIEVEVWKYDPRRLARGNAVDPFSLSLRFRGAQDERVEAAVEEMMEAAW